MILIDICKEVYFLFIDMAIYIMLGLFFVGLLHILFSKNFVVKQIGKKTTGSIIKASLFGVPLPLCSCGVIPTDEKKKKNGASKSAVVSFLISTPQTGVDSIIATYGMLGGIFALFRAVAAFFMGIIGGIIAMLFSPGSKKSNEIELNESNCLDCSNKKDNNEKDEKQKNILSRIKSMLDYAFVEFLDDISSHFIIGLIISALIAYFVPDDFFSNYDLNKGIVGMLIMIAIGLPMYICATASIPVAVTLILKGFSPGAAFVFLAVGPVTNAASLTILIKTLGKKIVSIYLISIASLSIIFGIIFDKLLYYCGINTADFLNIITKKHEHNIFCTFKYIFAAIFLMLLFGSLYRKYFKMMIKKKRANIKKLDELIINIEGMTCNHCTNNVKKNLMNFSNVVDVQVNLEQKKAFIMGNNLDKDAIVKKIVKIGYKVPLRQFYSQNKKKF